MTVVRLRGIKSYRHPKTGRLYTYHRATNTRIKAELGTPEFLAELAAIETKAAGPKKPAAGTLALVIQAYRESPAWANLSHPTRVSYDRGFAVLEPIGAMPLTKLDRPFIVGLQEKVFAKRGRWMANYVVAVLSILSEYGMDRGWMKANPADGVKRIKRDRAKAPPNRPWTREETGAVMDALPPYLRVPVALAMYGGFRKTDVLKVTKAAVREGLIEVATSKRGVVVRVPIHPDLAGVLASAPRHASVTIAANQAGHPWTVSGYNSTFGKAIERLEKAGTVQPGLTMHGLRHTLGTRLREAGADLDDIRRILGQKTLVMAQHYSETADTSERSRAIVERLDITRRKPSG